METYRERRGSSRGWERWCAQRSRQGFLALQKGCQQDSIDDEAGLLTNDRLDGLVNVVVDVLVGLNTAGDLFTDNRGNRLGALVGVSLFLQLGSVFRDHVVLGLSNNFGHNVEFMLGVQDLLVNNGLNSVLVVVNVSFSVNGLDGLDLFPLLDVFLDDFRGGFRADLGAVVVEGEPK